MALIRSTTTRQTVAASLQFAHDLGRDDILDPTKTNTWLVALLKQLRADYGESFLVEAVRRDHHNDAALGPHSHACGGSADIVCNDYPRMLNCVARNPYCWTVLLGGNVQDYAAGVTWPNDPRFYHGSDNTQPHLHLQCGNEHGEGPRQ